jgi:hypothetical protein
MLSEQEYVDLARTKYQELKKLQQSKNFYEYEKRFDEIWIELGKAVLEKSISDIPGDRRKKNFE